MAGESCTGVLDFSKTMVEAYNHLGYLLTLFPRPRTIPRGHVKKQSQSLVCEKDATSLFKRGCFEPLFFVVMCAMLYFTPNVVKPTI